MLAVVCCLLSMHHSDHTPRCLPTIATRADPHLPPARTACHFSVADKRENSIHCKQECAQTAVVCKLEENQLKNSPPCVLVVIALFAPHSGPLLFSCTRNWHDAINLTHSPYITICSCIVRYRGFCLSRAVTTMYHVATVTSHSFVLLSTIPVFMCKLHPIHHVTTSV